MRIKCIANTGEHLLNYKNKPRYISKNTTYGLLEIGKEYLVMGMLMGEHDLAYLIDDTLIVAHPFQLFEVVENTIPPNWYFKAFTKDFDNYKDCVWGYYELVFDDLHYEKLVDVDEDAQRLYFRRKIELEKWIEDQEYLK